jgi:hypothetical protein
MSNYIQGKDGKLQGSRPGNARAEKTALNSRADQRHYPDRTSLDTRRIQLDTPGGTGQRIAGERRATLGALQAKGLHSAGVDSIRGKL